ncbi:MAG: BrnA antitoxin family protein [Bauldia sp.]
MARLPFRPRATSDVMKAAEAVFRPAPPKLPDGTPKPVALPGARESVTLRLDSDVLAFFQEDGPGWQERINAALRKAAGK